jgi:FG-GAP-like repeat
MPSASPNLRLFLLAFGLASLASCGSGEDPNESETTAIPGNQILFVTEGQDASSELANELARRDAGVDGWPTEVLHDLAKASLKSWTKHLVDASYPAEKLAAHAVNEFEASAALVYPELAEVLNQQGLVVRRAEQLPDATWDYAELCAAYRERLIGAVDVHADVKIVSVDPKDSDHYSTRAYVQTLAILADGSPLQINHEWRVHWKGTPETENVLLTEVETLAYEEFQAPRPLLGDITEHVFGALPFFETDFLLGAGELYRRKDRLAGTSYMGWQGIAIGDVDGNGLEDLYVCQPGGLANRLFLRQLDGSVLEAAQNAGVAFLDNTRGALLLDLDNDGDQDLVVSMGPNLVVGYNDGRGRFARLVPLACEGTAFVHSLASADIDQDGDLDLYACRYNTSGEAGALGGGLPVPYHDADNGGANVLWRNEGGGKFVDATAAFGLDQNNHKFSLAAIFEDFDEDGDLDLYVTNDFGRNSFYRNDGGSFSDVADDVGLGELAASMGASAGDFDRDGDMDIYLSNMFSSAGLRIVSQEGQWRPEERDVAADFISHARGNFLLVNEGDGNFVDQTELAGVEIGRWAWGARFVDFDNDGFEDIYVPNGFVTGPDTEDL